MTSHDHRRATRRDSRFRNRRRLQPLKALIVEDNPGDAELAGERLCETPSDPFDLHFADSLARATQLLVEQPMDVLIVDLNLPDSHGLETLRRLKALTGHARVVVVSGSVDAELRQQALDAGADDVFDKVESNSRLFSRSVLFVVERSRAREHHQLEMLLETTPDAILVVDFGGEVQYVNQSALEMFARTRDDFVGERVSFSIREGETSEVRILRAGEARTCEIRVARFEWQREPAWLASMRDITEEKRLRTQLAVSDRMVSIGTLAAGVAHEVNNPLAALIANLQLLESDLRELGVNTDIPSEMFDELRDAQDAADRVRQIVRDVKLFSRAEEEVRGAVDLHEVLDSTTRLAWTEIRHRARLVKDFGPTPPVFGNEARLGQVFLNLIINAAQAIPEGNLEAHEIRITTGTDDEGRVTVAIRDTGDGIPASLQGLLFTPFFTTKPVGNGTGLGLTICHRIVNAMGGEITFSSTEGEGTCFTVSLPTAVDSDGASPAPVDEPDAPDVLVRARVLVIDDEPSILVAVRRILGTRHQVVAVDSGVAALRCLDAEPAFDLILCDLMMPQMTGAQFYDRVVARGRGEQSRIVFLTGGAFTPTAQEFLSRVTNTCVEKPFDIRALRALIEDRLT